MSYYEIIFFKFPCSCRIYTTATNKEVPRESWLGLSTMGWKWPIPSFPSNLSTRLSMSTQTKIWVKNKKPWRMQCKSWSKNIRIGKLIVSLWLCFFVLVRLNFFQNFKLHKIDASYFHTSYEGHGFHCIIIKKTWLL